MLFKVEKMNLVETIDYIQQLKEVNPINNTFRLIRICNTNDKQLIGNKGYKTPNMLYLNMKNDYFPKELDVIYMRDMQIYNDMDNSIYELLEWGTQLILLFQDELKNYINLKQEYEKYLFSEKYENAYKTLCKLEKSVCYSMWGIQQKYLLRVLQNRQEEIKKEIFKLENRCSKKSLMKLMLFYYYRMVDSEIDFEEYNNQINHLLETGDKNSPIFKYCKYKLDIVSPKTVQEVKWALVFDEQISFIDYYETYIDALQILSKRKDITHVLKKCVINIYKNCTDSRIRNLSLTLFNPKDIHFSIDNRKCSLIENYTCGNYSELNKAFALYIENDFIVYNLLVKSGINISNNDIPYKSLWKEIYNVYMLSYNKNSIEIINKYYKIFYCTSWKYKLLGIMVRKLNFNYDDHALKLAILNDYTLTPLFYQIIEDTTNRVAYIKAFESNAPATTQLHLFMLNETIDRGLINKVLPIRFRYYEVKKYYEQKDYQKCIKMCKDILLELSSHKSLYYEERIRRILYNSYVKENNYIEGMKLYVDSYIITKKLVERMSLNELIPKIDDELDEYSQLRQDISTPIIYRFYYKNLDEEVISSYLDYLESKQCTTIKNLLNTYKGLTKHEIIFLDKVCTQSLLINDYVSKSEVGGSAAELRAEVLRILLKYDEEGEKEYLAELNSLYKSIQLQKKIDSFNHTRIFIDKSNLLKYLKDELTQEFSKYRVVQELRTALNSNTNEVISPSFVLDEYWDYHKFFYEMIDRIKREYLNESPYSLEDFLSARIRHNYCNDNLKKVFEEENLFSKKIKDNSREYIVNEYWKNKLSADEYERVILALSKFSKKIDEKIQEITEKWIRIKNTANTEGMFDYSAFTDYFFNYVEIDFEQVIEDPEQFIRSVIIALDKYTNKILSEIRLRIDTDLKPYYNEAICTLETDIKRLSFTTNAKNEMLRQIEISKARYIEDIDGFKDIFNMENEKYPDFTMRELIDFCVEIERGMNNKFSIDKVNTVIHCRKRYSGEIFSYLVDIVAILIRNAVQHSEINNMEELNIDIKIIPYKDSEIQCRVNENTIIKDENNSIGELSVVFDVSNNLNSTVDTEITYENARKIISNICKHKFKEESSKEGGSGLYKIARTVCYNLNTYAAFCLIPSDNSFKISIAVDLTKFEKEM